MKVVHVSISPVAGSAAYLVKAINEHSAIDAVLVSNSNGSYGDGRIFPKPDILNINSEAGNQAILEADIVHFHNIQPVHGYATKWTDKPLVFQYHTPGWSQPNQVSKKAQRWCCVAQLHMVNYSDAIPVPNVLPMSSPLYAEVLPYEDRASNGRLEALWTPSNRNAYAGDPTSHSKGVPEAEDHIRGMDGVGFNVVLGQPIDKLVGLKKEARLGIDDIVTGGYHRSTLEFLAVGTPVICKLHPKCKEWLTSWGNGEGPPIIESDLSAIAETLGYFKDHEDELIGISRASRLWMEKNWVESRTLEPYLVMYEELLN